MIKLPPTSDPSTVVEDLEGFFSRFLALGDGLALVLALWSLATHLFEQFDAFPYLAITSPTKRCGKTRACELISFVCFQPLQTVNASAPALYRSLREGKRTLLIDEAESLSRPKDDRTSALREILNAGYRKGPEVLRCKRKSKGGKDESEETYEVERFDPYCPKALVLIGRLQDTLADRCIEIRMERRGDANVERFRFARVEREIRPLQRAANIWARQNRLKVREHYEQNDVLSLQDRESELWLPLFSVCAVATPESMQALEYVSFLLSAAKSGEEPAEYNLLLLRDCREVFDNAKRDRLSTSELLQTLNAQDDRPWSGWFRGRELNAHGLSRLLHTFRIQPQNIRMGNRIVKGYLRTSFQECWDRYL